MPSAGRGHRPLHRISRAIWTDERGLSVFLSLVLLWVFVIPHFQPRGGAGSVPGDLFFTALILTGALTVDMRRWVRAVVVGVALLALAIRLLEDLGNTVAAVETRLASHAVSCALLAAIVLFRVFSGGQVTKHRILGAVSGYLLLGITWATLYGLVETASPGAFSQSSSSSGRGDWLYYSFVTLTTVGYGDVTPVHSVARTLAILEALIGQLYPAILIARLVAQEIGSRRP